MRGTSALQLGSETTGSLNGSLRRNTPPSPGSMGDQGAEMERAAGSEQHPPSPCGPSSVVPSRADAPKRRGVR